MPDVERGICRACIIYGCKTCTTEGESGKTHAKKDLLEKILSGFSLDLL